MRVTACLMVIVVHSTEPFYLGGEGSLVLTQADGLWAAAFDTFVRACVPLFVVASSYLLFPLRTSTSVFLRRRAVRILLPFAVWSVVYAIVWGSPADNFRDLLFNFNYAAGHLWFVYMLVGLYLLMPLLSGWAERVERRELLFYIGLCLFTTLIPLLRDWLSPGVPPMTYGPSGIPAPAHYPLWGEASWNTYGLFYYFSGFMGYLLFGLYLRRFVGTLSWSRTLAIALPAWALGFAITFGGFVRRLAMTASAGYPVEGPVDMAVWWETTWTNDTIGVALMTIGWVLLWRRCTAAGTFYRRLLVPVSRASYGMYLCHLLILVYVSASVRDVLGTGTQGLLGLWTTPAEIIISAILTFLVAAIACTLLQRLPRIGKWIVG